MTRKNEKFTYRVRPGYGSKNLLIEFTKDSESKEFCSALKGILSKINAKCKQTDDLWMNDEMTYHIKSDIGRFQISSDSWGCLFIFPFCKEKVIASLDVLLSESDLFLKEEVDYKEFA